MASEDARCELQVSGVLVSDDQAAAGFERWYRWAGVPDGTLYRDADRMVSEAVGRLEAERDELRRALEGIVDCARAGNWQGPEVPDPVAAAIAHGEVVLRRATQR